MSMFLACDGKLRSFIASLINWGSRFISKQNINVGIIETSISLKLVAMLQLTDELIVPYLHFPPEKNFVKSLFHEF